MANCWCPDSIFWRVFYMSLSESTGNELVLDIAGLCSFDALITRSNNAVVAHWAVFFRLERTSERCLFFCAYLSENLGIDDFPHSTFIFFCWLIYFTEVVRKSGSTCTTLSCNFNIWQLILRCVVKYMHSIFQSLKQLSLSDVILLGGSNGASWQFCLHTVI